MLNEVRDVLGRASGTILEDLAGVAALFALLVVGLNLPLLA